LPCLSTFRSSGGVMSDIPYGMRRRVSAFRTGFSTVAGRQGEASAESGEAALSVSEKVSWFERLNSQVEERARCSEP